ncbi:MAG: type II toxin-antitoxin system VapC family toxin [Candidatus Contendobacter sp.]|nr:type II toxin-antitoxin system VapC family toxin [Candidatus Contendobacter sp.]
MKESIYIETSIFSFYYDERPDPSIRVRREWTMEWWKNCRSNYVFITSTAVLDELSRGNKLHKGQALDLAMTLPAIAPTDEIAEIVQIYVAHHVMPKDPMGDALHLALASFHKCDYLLTWNCQNIANANKFAHIRRINALLGLHVPELVTPLQLMRQEL